MCKKIFSLILLSYALVFSAAKDDEATKKRAIVPLKPIEMSDIPPISEDLKILFGPKTWGRNNAGWNDSAKVWFSGAGYSDENVTRQRHAFEKKSQTLYQKMIEGERVPRKIPPSIHRVWVTADDKPHEPPQDRIDDYLRMMDQLGEEFTSVFWCLDKIKIPNAVKQLEAHKRIEVRELTDLWARDLRGRAMYERLYKERLFVLCSYVLRYKIIENFGGIYADFGVQVKKLISPLLSYDSFFGQSGFLLSNRFFGAQAGDAGLRRLVTFIDLLDFTASSEMRTKFKGVTSPVWVGLWALTLSHELGRNLEDNVLYLDNTTNPFYEHTGMRSWLLPNVENFGQKPVQAEDFDPLNVFFSAKTAFSQVNVVQAWASGRERDIDRMTRLAHFFYGEDLGRSKDQERAHIVSQRQASIKRTIGKLFEGDLTPAHYAPHINHQMWITKSTQIPDTHIDATIQRCKSLGEEWTHVLWVIDAEVLAPSIAKLKAHLPDLEVRQVYDHYLRKDEDAQPDEPKRRMRAQGVFEGFFQGGAFVTATDVFRKIVLFDEGGFYADMGIMTCCNITPLFDCAHGIFYANPETQLFDTGVMMAAPNDPVLRRYFDVMDKIHTYESLAKNPDANDQLLLIGQGLYNASYAQDCSDKVTIPLVLGQTLFNPNHMGSWKQRKAGLQNVPFTAVIGRNNMYKMSLLHNE